MIRDPGSAAGGAGAVSYARTTHTSDFWDDSGITCICDCGPSNTVIPGHTGSGAALSINCINVYGSSAAPENTGIAAAAAAGTSNAPRTARVRLDLRSIPAGSPATCKLALRCKEIDELGRFVAEGHSPYLQGVLCSERY